MACAQSSLPRALALFALILAGVLGLALAALRHAGENQADSLARTELRLMADALGRELAARGSGLAKAAAVLAEDPGLARALVGADLPQAGATLGERVRGFGADLALLVSLDGRVLLDVFDAMEPAADFPDSRMLRLAATEGSVAGYLGLRERVHQLVLVPVPGPAQAPAAWLALGVPLGDAELAQLRFPGDAHAYLFALEARGGRLLAASSQGPTRLALSNWLADRSSAPAALHDASLAGGEHWIQVVPLHAADGNTLAVALSMPRNAAQLPIWAQPISLAAMFVFGLLAAVLLAWRLFARGDGGALAASAMAANPDAAAREPADLSDPITGLVGRDGFLAEVDALLRERPRPCILLVARLARWNALRDAFGDALGDDLLGALGRRLRGRGDWLAARVGDADFALFCPLDEASADAWEVSVRALLEVPVELRGQSFDAGIHLGSASSPDDGSDATLLLRRACTAMRQGMDGMGGHVAFDARFEADAAHRLVLLEELRTAIEADRLQARFRPRARLADGRVVACALETYWPHAQFGDMGMDDFLLVAEQGGLIRPFTRWLVSTAAARAGEWRALGLDIAVGLRLPSRALADHEVVELLAGALARHNLPPEALIVEIGDVAHSEDIDTAVAVVHAIGALGLQVAMADPGGVCFSLDRLARLPVNQLIIHRSSVQRMLGSAQDAVFVHATIDLAHALGMCVVAEGVDSIEFWGPLGFHGCDQAQGDHVGPCMQAEELVAWFARTDAGG